MHWASQYIGLPWSAQGEGPDSFHCWAFVRHIQGEHFGRPLPEIPNPEELLTLARAFRDHPERQRWDPAADGADGDCVLLRQARYPVHVGVWLDVEAGDGSGGVLHCSRDCGVVFQRPDALMLNGWKIEGFYRFKGVA